MADTRVLDLRDQSKQRGSHRFPQGGAVAGFLVGVLTVLFVQTFRVHSAHTTTVPVPLPPLPTLPKDRRGEASSSQASLPMEAPSSSAARPLPRRQPNDGAIIASSATTVTKDVTPLPVPLAPQARPKPRARDLTRQGELKVKQQLDPPPALPPLPPPPPTQAPVAAPGTASRAADKSVLKSMTDLVNEFVLGSAPKAEAGAEERESPSALSMTKAACSKRYGQLRFFTEKERRPPPMLYTFPGSGNTWGRLLIEHATGIYSGSVYNDKSLLEALPGEFTCNFQVSVIKVHPHTHPGIELVDGSFSSDDHKCLRSNLRKFERALLLVRDPFDSIWSEYQRRVTQNHVLGIRNETFDWYRWTANAANLATGYFEMWAYHYAAIERKLRQKDVLFLRYEDLKDKARRVDTLQRVAEFLHVAVPRDRLECAFVLAENTQAHRKVDPRTTMTKDVAYTRPIACRMWALFGRFAARVGYPMQGPRAAYNCTGFPPIVKVNVGGSGEYNPLWVRPGGRPIDFGEHPPSNFVWGTVQRPRGLEDMWVVNGEKVLMRNKPGPRPKPVPRLQSGTDDGGGGGGGVGGGSQASAAARRAQRRAAREGTPRPKAAVAAAGASAGGAPKPAAKSPGPVLALSGGMALTDALAVEGIGGVGADQPAWV